MSYKMISWKQFASSILIVAMLILTPMSNSVSYAAIKKNPAATQIETLVSNETYRKEYFKIRTPKKEKYVIYVSGKVKSNIKRLCIRIKKHGTNKVYITTFVQPNGKGEFSIKINTKKGNKKVPVVLNKKGTVTNAKESISTCPGFQSVQKMTAGTYHMSITAATTKASANVKGTAWKLGTLGGSEGTIYKEAVFTVKNGQNNNLKLIKYKDVVKNNQDIRKKYEKTDEHITSYKGSQVRYKDVYMKDIPFVFRNPKTQKYEYLSKQQVKYIDNVAKQITKGCTTNYQKVQKIYEYVAKNVYYDNLALSEHKNQYANPYTNLYNLRHKKNSANSKNGKVATTCQGYAALVVALARAEGIPARFAYGRHIHQPGTIWTDIAKDDLNTVTHYWSEVYINGKWIVADARSAMKNSWKRISFSSKGMWVKKYFINYSHFDPTDVQLASSYIYVGIYPGSKDGKYINRLDEVEQMRNFLNTRSEDGISNGELLNAKYKSSDFSTWGTGKENNFLTNGYGRVFEIMWPDKGLSGDLDFSNMIRLKSLDLNDNNIQSVNLSECSKLVHIDLKNNPLIEAVLRHKGDIYTVSATEGGTFSVRYNKESENSLTIYAKAMEGYTFLGIYDNETGECISDEWNGTMNPGSSSYTVRFVVNETVNDWNDMYDNPTDDEKEQDTNIQPDIPNNEGVFKDDVTGEVIIDEITGEVMNEPQIK